MSALLTQAPAGRETRGPQTDQTVPVARGARLIVDNFAGEVIVKAWDRDQLRVQARHPSRVKIGIRTTGTGITVRADSSGPPASVDYEIMAPAWMPMKVEGTYNFITVEGSQSDVTAETTRGDIVIKGGAGAIVAKSVQGEVLVEGARGRITVSSVNEGIRIMGASGDITAETTNGSISMTGVTSSIVDATTINGDVVFEGSMADNGRYRFATHNGDITAAVPENSNATFIVRTYTGDFSTNLQLTGPPRSETRRGRRATYTLGKGSAEMDLETFGGSIRIRRPGAAASRERHR
ncbi:MAG: DUF4097 family beta strand repeat-containing protein [Vicinamibacterales bacterium]